MHELTLLRSFSDSSATIGAFYIHGVYVVDSLELPWKDNAKGISCIPEGIYELVLSYSPRFGRMLYEVKNVPGRRGIRIHSANYTSQLHGCIAPGIRVEHHTAIKSREAYGRLARIIQSHQIDTLTVLSG